MHLNVKINVSFVNISSEKMLVNSHLMRRCNQPFARGLDSSHLFLRQSFRNLLTDGINVYMNLEDMLTN